MSIYFRRIIKLVHAWGAGASEEGPRVVMASARDASAEVKTSRHRERRGRRGRLDYRRPRAARQRAARGGLSERACGGPGAGGARLACLTLPVERV